MKSNKNFKKCNGKTNNIIRIITTGFKKIVFLKNASESNKIISYNYFTFQLLKIKFLFEVIYKPAKVL